MNRDDLNRGGEFENNNEGYEDQTYDENYDDDDVDYDGGDYDDDYGDYHDDDDYQGDDDYGEEYGEEELYYSDGIKGTIEYAIDYLNSFDPKIKKMVGITVIALAVIVVSLPLLKKLERNPKVPTMVAMSIEGLPVDENGEVINPVFDKEGQLMGIPVHPDIQQIYGQIYYPGQEKEDVMDLDSLSKWAEGQVNPNGEERDEDDDIMNEPEPGVEPDPIDYTVTIDSLPAEFYSRNPDTSKIQETNYRNLGVVPKHDSQNNFLVYNWEGNLNPLSGDGDYINREIIGRVFNYKMFTSVNEYEVQDVAERNLITDIPVYLSNNFNRAEANQLIKNEIVALREEGVYKDLELRTDDYVSNYIINIMDNSNNDAVQSTSYFIPDAKFNVELGGFQQFQHDLMEQIIKDIEIIPSRQLNNEQLGKIHYKLYNYLVDMKVREYKKVACDELNVYKKGMCSNPNDISTLEIKSDFIQDAYVKAYRESIEHYYYVMYRVYDKINPVNMGE